MAFICASCKKTLNTEPANKNACGSFCAECEQTRKENMKIAMRRRSEMIMREKSTSVNGVTAQVIKQPIESGLLRVSDADSNIAQFEKVELCKYCGFKVDIRNDKIGHICKDCIRMRDQLLKCIRYSDHVIRYVNSSARRKKS